MIAYVLHGKRDLRAEERPDPVAMPGEVLIEVRRMGICGSDVHYFAAGHCGSFIPRQPFVLGHEVAGEVVSTGAGVEGISTGQRVAVDPSHPCGVCSHCRAGRSNVCPDMRYLGSAAVVPHVDGAFASYISIPAGNCYPLPDNVDYAEAAFLEPISVATHAVKRAGSVTEKSVLILGAGTVGQLVLLVARALGAANITITDLRQEVLDLASAQGADRICLATNATDELVETPFDVIFEVSGSSQALRAALELSKRGGTIVQVGSLPTSVELPAHLIMQKELQVMGSLRFANVFPEALELIASGKVDVHPINTHTFGFRDFVEAFETAVEDKSALKIQVES